jgi:hypothetical protein
MLLYHCTDRKNLASIQQHGLLVSKADPQAKIQGVWAATASNRPWAILHTIKKHHAALEDVVVIEITVPRSWMTRFCTGLYFSTQDIPPTRLGAVIEGATFGASASE